MTQTSRSIDAAGMAFAVALHAVAAAALLSHEPARSVTLPTAPLMVSLVSPPREQARPAPPVLVPPKPRTVAKPRRRPAPAPTPMREPEPPVLSAPLASPSPVATTPPAPPEPAAIVAAPPAPPAPAPVIVTDPIFNADYLDNPPPPYPAASRRNGEQGRVLLRVLVNVHGRAENVQVRDSSGHRRLDEAALDTVKRWRFVPAKRGDRAVEEWVLIPVSFRLAG